MYKNIDCKKIDRNGFCHDPDMKRRITLFGREPLYCVLAHPEEVIDKKTGHVVYIDKCPSRERKTKYIGPK